MCTRRKGRWLLKQPRLGARMCLGTFFFCAGKTGADTPGYRCIIYWSARSDRKFSKQTPSGSGICSAFDAEIHLEIKSAAFWTETEKSTPFSASAIRIEAKISPVPCRDEACRGRQAGALRKRLLAGQIIFKAFFPMDQAGQTCDDDFGPDRSL